MRKGKKFARRLLRLAAFLEKLPRKRFDYGNWVGDDWKGKPDLSCGTTACALGWATAMPEFRRLGLVMVQELNDEGVSVTGYVALKGIRYSNEYDAACEVFGMEHDDIDRVFMPGDAYTCSGLPLSATPKQVARHIRKFVKRETGVVA